MMKRIIFTDLRRAQRKPSYFMCMGIVVVLMIIITIVAFLKPAAAESLAESTETSGKGLAFLNNIGIAYSMIPFLVGIPVFLTVFSDDFKSRTMQTAIGHGISRRRLVLCRFYEVIALLVEACLILSVLGIIMGLVLGASMGGLATMVGKMFFDLLLIVANTSIAMLILYLAMNPTGGLVMYILMAADVFKLLLVLADQIPFMKDNGIKVSYIVPSGVYTLAENNLFGHVPTFADIATGTDIEEGSAEAIQKIFEGTVQQDFLKAFGYTALLVGVYIVLPLVLSQVVFRKKELDF